MEKSDGHELDGVSRGGPKRGRQEWLARLSPTSSNHHYRTERAGCGGYPPFYRRAVRDQL